MNHYNDDFTRLDELGFVGRGRSRHRPRNDKSLFGGKYPFIQTADVKKANYYLTEYSVTYNEKGLNQSKLWDKETLCITIAAHIAENAILGIKACFPDSIIGFIPDKSKADLKFVKYCLDTYKIQIQSISQGATQDNLSLEKLRSINFRVPSLFVQNKIGDILYAYDNLIENNKKRIAILEKMAEQIYKEWFVRMRFPGHEQTKFVNGIPEGWEVSRIGILYDTSSGATPSRTKMEYYKDGSINWIKTGELTDGFIYATAEKITSDAINNSSAKIFPRGTTIFAMYGATIGKIGITNEPAATNQACCAIINKNDVFTQYFIFSFLKHYRPYIIGMAQGAAQQNVNQDEIKKTAILKPVDDIVIKFNNTVNPFYDQIISLELTNKILNKTRDLLLPRLISGKLPVDKIKTSLS